MPARPLIFPLTNSTALEESDVEFSGCDLATIFPADPDEITSVVLDLSLNQYVVLASVIDVGRDIAYPENSFGVWLLWVKVLQCMEFCARVAECIESDAGVQAALNAFMGQSGYNPAAGSNYQTPTALMAANLLPADVGCDDDKAWGHIRDGLIERSFQRVIDVLEQIELITDNQEMLSETIAGIPILGEVLEAIGVDSWINWFDEVREFAFDAFSAGDTLAFRDAAACDLFCIWQQNCSLSTSQIYNYWKQRAISLDGAFSDAFATFITLVNSLSSPQSQTSEFFVCFLMASSYGFINFINSWFGITIQQVRSDLLVGEASNDWTTLCAACPDCPAYFDYYFQGAWSIEAGYNPTLDSSGWYLSGSSDAPSDNPQWIVVGNPETFSATYVYVKVDISENDNLNFALTVDISGTPALLDFASNDEGGIRTYTAELPGEVETSFGSAVLNINSPDDIAFRLLSVEMCN